jgi:hypothetical protein
MAVLNSSAIHTRLPTSNSRTDSTALIRIRQAITRAITDKARCMRLLCSVCSRAFKPCQA